MMFRETFLWSVLLLLMLPASGFSQDKKKESSAPTSVRSYPKYDRTTSSTDLLNEAGDLQYESPAEALEKVKEALAVSITNKDILSEAKCYVLLGEINMNIKEYKLALENYLTAYYKLSPDHTRKPEYLKALKGLGHSNLKLGNYKEALNYFQEILSQGITAKEKAETQIDISETFFQMGNYPEALEIVERISYNRKIADPVMQLRIENQKTKIYAQTNQIEKASQSLESSQRILQSNSGAIPRQEEEAVQSAKEEVSDALSEQARYDDQIILRNRSIESNRLSKNLGEVSKDKVALSKALVAKGETSAAIRELEEAAQIADTIGDPKKQATAFLSLAELYQDHGNETKALRSYRKYTEALTRAEKLNETKLLEKSELIKQQRDIEELSKYLTLAQQQEKLTEAMVSRQRLIIYGLVFIVLITAVTSYLIFKNAQASKKANQLLALKSLRSQMNPHFIFNALNSLNQFVAENDERTANKFLSEFSRLMRLVLENSQLDFISLLREEEIIMLYLKLEHYRFRDKFDYEIRIDEDINKELVYVPPMLIQPYIENAVWHGLRYKNEKGFLSIHIKRHGDEKLLVEIADNGIGRKRSVELKTENQKKHESTGLKNIRERLRIINTIYKSDYQVAIEDIGNDLGTKVLLQLPVNQKIHA